MQKIRISAVRYANTYPFIYGLTESGFESRALIGTDHPSECAARLISGRADLGLVPVAAIPLIEGSRIIGDYCIGANGKVRTVQLMSDSKPETAKRVFLDYRSRTSVNLIKVIARNFWLREPEWINTTEGFDFKSVGRDDAVVLIGDQCFELENRYACSIDLAEEWKNFTGLPFVFACWIANQELPADFICDFNKALALGVNNIDRVAERFENTGTITGKALKVYLKNNIDYNLDELKRKAMDLFLGYLSKL